MSKERNDYKSEAKTQISIMNRPAECPPCPLVEIVAISKICVYSLS